MIEWSDVAVAAGGAVFGALIAPFGSKLIRETPADPEDDPQPIPRAGPWLAQSGRLAILLAVVGAAVGGRAGAHPVAAAHVVVAIGLVVLSVIDLDLFLLPKRIVYPLIGATGLLLAGAALVDSDGASLRRAVLCGLGAFGALFVLHVISPAGMGFGDVRLAGLIGLNLGWLGTQQVVAGIFAGFVCGAGIGLALMATRKRGRRDAVPFGPFLAIGTLFILLWRPSL
jgi:leader peptidase (prepilin peptidase)/N-methyltransferase